MRRLSSSVKATNPNAPIPILYPTNIPEIDEQILLYLDDKTVFNLCRINTYTAGLCRKNGVWLSRIIDVFGVNLAGYLGGRSARAVYKKLATAKRKDKLLGAAVLGGYTPLVKTYTLAEILKYYTYKSSLAQAIAQISDPELFQYMLSILAYEEKAVTNLYYFTSLLRYLAEKRKYLKIQTVIEYVTRTYPDRQTQEFFTLPELVFAKNENIDGFLFLIEKYDLNPMDLAEKYKDNYPLISAYFWSQDIDSVIYGIGQLFARIISYGYQVGSFNLREKNIYQLCKNYRPILLRRVLMRFTMKYIK